MLQPKGNVPQHEWIVIYTASNIPEAQIVAGRLHAEGVDALVNYPIGGTALGIRLGSISVLVRPHDSEIAQQILFADDEDVMAELTEGYEDALHDWQDFEIHSEDENSDDDDDDDGEPK